MQDLDCRALNCKQGKGGVLIWGLSGFKRMSAQKKRNFQIEAFKHRVVVDPKYAEKTWKILEHAIHEIYNHNASGLSFEELYRFTSLFF